MAGAPSLGITRPSPRRAGQGEAGGGPGLGPAWDAPRAPGRRRKRAWPRPRAGLGLTRGGNTPREADGKGATGSPRGAWVQVRLGPLRPRGEPGRGPAGGRVASASPRVLDAPGSGCCRETAVGSDQFHCPAGPGVPPRAAASPGPPARRVTGGPGPACGRARHRGRAGASGRARPGRRARPGSRRRRSGGTRAGCGRGTWP